ncbi:MAG TPA: M20 family metallopeptidase, partial [Planctomycetaceae bacterium]|nr:M20 family metallopeptidase [Planctomycetaceae bacterium]
QRIEVAAGRANVLARFESPGAKRTVLLDAHQDTVPTDGMNDPFNPVIRDGKLFGRGSCDVKGGLAAMLSAFARLVRERPAGAANVILSCTCDEESTSLGVNDLALLWSNPQRAGSLIDRRPDVAIIAEPTQLDVVVAHRGATRWKIRTDGRACHSSSPQDGINAIYRMSHVVTALEEFAELLPQRITPHPLCGSATLSVGRITGGISVNTVPDCCEIEIDRRVIPGEDGWDAITQVRQHLHERLDFDVEHLPPWLVGVSLSDEHNGPLGDQLLEQISSVAGPHRKLGVPYGTHASRIAAAGVPSVVFGPGDIAQAHTINEWIDISQLRHAAEIYFRYCAIGPK